MSKTDFCGVAILTGYLQYLHNEYKYFLYEYVIEQFEKYNPDCDIPHDVAASSEFYLDTVLRDQSELQSYFVPMTEENAVTVLDNISTFIRRITEVQYPLKKLGILGALIDTQVHIEDVHLRDEIHSFLKHRLLDRKLYFLT